MLAKFSEKFFLGVEKKRKLECCWAVLLLLWEQFTQNREDGDKQKGVG